MLATAAVSLSAIRSIMLSCTFIAPTTHARTDAMSLQTMLSQLARGQALARPRYQGGVVVSTTESKYLAPWANWQEAWENVLLDARDRRDPRDEKGNLSERYARLYAEEPHYLLQLRRASQW